MKMETHVFNDTSLVRRLLSRRLLRVPVLLLAGLVVGSVVAASVLIGPPSPNQNQNIAEAIPAITGLNPNPFYGQIVGAIPFWFNVTVATNTYQVIESMRPLITVTNLTASTDVVLIASLNGITYSFTTPTVSGSPPTFTYDFGTGFEQIVNAGATGASAPTWYFQFHYNVGNLPAPVVTWSAQFVTGA